MRREETSPTFRQLEAQGVSYIERPGPGPAVFFLHGIGSSAHSFERLFEHLPATLRLIAWNAPGYLASASLDIGAPKASDYAETLLGLLDDIGLAQVHLVGHSLGTLIASAFAERARDRIASLTLAASAQGYGIEDGAPLLPKVAKRLEDLDAFGPEKFAETRAQGLVFEPNRNASVVARVQAEMSRINPAGYAQAVHMLASGDLAASVARVTQEPGFIIGAEDQVTPFDQTRAAADRWAEAHGTAPRIVTIPDAGHAVYVQAPGPFAAALLELAPALSSAPPTHSEVDTHDR